MRIAFLDSGIGGMTVLREAMNRLPEEDFIYYADTAHVPYGTKPREVVRQSLFEAVRELHAENIKALVIACNTATSIAAGALRCEFPFPIIGMEPAVKPAVERNLPQRKRVLVLATPLTLKESKFHDLVAKVDGETIVDTLPLPELVGYCERMEFRDSVIQPFLQEKLRPYPLEQYGSIVLGCTHFPYYREHLRRIVPAHVELIDGSIGTVNRLQYILDTRGIRGGGCGHVRFMSSKRDPEETERLMQAMKLLQSPEPPELTTG